MQEEFRNNVSKPIREEEAYIDNKQEKHLSLPQRVIRKV